MKASATIKVPTYNCELVFIITDKLKAQIASIYKKYKLPIFEDDGENEGIFLSMDIDKYHLLIDVNYLSHDTIAHELYHAVVRITEDRGIVDEEAQAWLCGHLTASFYKFIYKKNFKVKNG